MPDNSRFSRRAIMSALAAMSLSKPSHSYRIGDSRRRDPNAVPAELVDFRQSAARAVTRTVQDKLRDVVSVMDFGAVADGKTDDSFAFNSALATGENVFVPGGTYALASPVQIKGDGQALFGHGTYTTKLVWVADDPKKNMIELWSGRRTGDGGLNRTGQRLSGFMLSSAPGSAVRNAVFVEQGIFHSEVSNLRLLNFFGTVNEALIKLDSGGGLSYPVNPVLRDIIMTGVDNGTKIPIPRGVWLESCIEGYFERVAVFNVSDAWVIGSADTFRTVEDCRFIHCHVEIGNRDAGADDATGVRIFTGGNLNFFAMKINCGINDDGNFRDVTTQTCVEFMAHAAPHARMRNINFWGCRFWQYAIQTRPLVYFNSDADADQVLFDSPKVVGVTDTVSFIGSAADFDGDIQVRNPHFSNLSRATPLADLRGRRGVALEVGKLPAGATIEFNMSDDDGSAYGTPVQVSASTDLRGCHLSWYKTSATGVSKFSLWNLSNDTFDAGETRYVRRHFQPEDVNAAISSIWNPPVLSQANAGVTTVLPLPGARMGDFVKAAFSARAVNGMANAVCHGWVATDGRISVRLFSPAFKNFAEGLVTVYHLAPTFDYVGSATQGPVPLDALTGTSTTMSVPGAVMGDFVEVSFSADQRGVIMWAEVIAADVVSVRLFNSMPDPVELPAGDIVLGVRKRHSLF